MERILESDITGIRFVQRVRGERERFTDFFISLCDGRTFYSRRMYPIEDTPHARSAEKQEFLRRQNR